MTDDAPRSAGVRFPPPFIYALGLIATYLVDRALPLRLTAPEPPWLPWLGAIIALGGFSLSFSGVATFRRHHTSVNPTKSSSVIVTTGPYAFTRNPMYLGLAVVYAGVALVFNSWWGFITLVFVLVIVDRTVIRREERYLASAFGDEYEAYRAKVRRWL